MLFPPLSSEDYDRLKQSIAVSGQQVPILVDADTGEIIDGEHRLRACRELGIEPQVIERHLTEEERRTLPVSMNLARRHLTPEQKREFIANLRRQGWTQQEIGEILGVTRRRIGQMENEILVMEEISIANNATDDQPDNIPPAIPDLRVKIGKEHKRKIVARAEAGESQSQIAADYGISQGRVSQLVHNRERQREKQAQRESTRQAVDDNIVVGDFRDVGVAVADDSVDLIFTDPPYGEDSIGLYADLAMWAARVLKPGGSLLVYAGQAMLPETLAAMCPHLRYWWTISLKHGGPTQRFPGKFVFIGWKPILWMVKGARRDSGFVADFFESSPEKEYHEWQQGITEALYYIEKLTQPGELVADPFLGSGTTAVAAKQLGRRYWGAEINELTAQIVVRRITGGSQFSP